MWEWKVVGIKHDPNGQTFDAIGPQTVFSTKAEALAVMRGLLPPQSQLITQEVGPQDVNGRWVTYLYCAPTPPRTIEPWTYSYGIVSGTSEEVALQALLDSQRQICGPDTAIVATSGWMPLSGFQQPWGSAYDFKHVSLSTPGCLPTSVGKDIIRTRWSICPAGYWSSQDLVDT